MEGANPLAPGVVCSFPVPSVLSPRPPNRPDPDRDGSEGACRTSCHLIPNCDTFSIVKALIYDGQNGCVPMPPEKRCLIRSFRN
jgi:hypothetical protein